MENYVSKNVGEEEIQEQTKYKYIVKYVIQVNHIIFVVS